MKKKLSFFALLLFSSTLMAQTVTLTFTGRDANNNRCQMNRVVITNLTKSWQETIYWPDTTLVMQVGTGIEDYAAENTFKLSQNNPNPFNGTTDANLTVVESGDVSMEISDVNGRIVETQNFATLQTGNYRFRIQVSAAGIYFLTARQRGKSSTIKMVNKGGGIENSMEFVGLENQDQAFLKTKNSIKGATNNPFSSGDQMDYVGYATFNGAEVESQRIQQVQGASQTITLRFNAVQAQLPTVTTFDVTDITPTSAVCGGNVTSDGGANVTSRGVCWSANQNPTISGNHTTDDLGVGSFYSNLTGLTANTTYYVRAYAINSVGVAYGNTEIFTATYGQPCPNAATVTDVDGNVYNTIQIGNQCWMKENLRTTKYADGTSISLGSSTSTTTAYRYCPNNDSSNVAIYGYLYNWKAVVRNPPAPSAFTPINWQGICPNGWHVASFGEWGQLTDYVSSQSQYVCGDYYLDIAKALASTVGWNYTDYYCAVGNDPSTNNATGFSAIPAGQYRGFYNSLGSYAYFWTYVQIPTTTDDYAQKALYYDVYYDNSRVNTTNALHKQYKYYGLSVRCVKD